MQRKQQVGECWVCVIFFARVVVSERMHRARRGLEGGVQGGRAPQKKNYVSGNVTPTSGNMSCI